MLASLYKLLTFAATPVFQRILRKRAKGGKENVERLNERMGRPEKPRPEGALVWFHGASVGESLSALPLIEKIQSENPNVHILVTTGTVTSAGLMAKRLGGKAFHQFMPLDHPRWVAQFLDHWQPTAVIWLESDFWPNMLLEIKRRNIPAILLNARMGQKSFKKWSLYAPATLADILKTFDICMTQSAEEKRRLEHFKHGDVRVTDNLKYAASKLPVDSDKKDELIRQMQGRPVWQFASTHPGEEALTAQIHQKLKKDFPKLLSVIIPRHPARGAEIQKILSSEGLRAARRSQGQNITPQTDIYIADTLGEMGVFFDAIDITVIGGSFVDHGGHNPIEPAQFGNLVIYGPHMFNFKLMCEDFEDAGAAVAVSDDAALEEMLKRSLSEAEYIQPYQVAGLQLTREKSAALSNLWQIIAPWLKKAMAESSTR